MANYGEMQARIANELNRADLGSYIPSAIQSAIKHYERERWYFNEAVTSSSLTTSSSLALYPLPTDFMKMDNVKVTIDGWKNECDPIPYIEMDRIDPGNGALNGPPRFWAVYANQLRYYPVPDSAYVVTISYQKRLTTLSASADTNEWVDDLEELIRSKSKEIICRHKLRDYVQANDLLSYVNNIVYPMARAENDERLMSGKLNSGHRAYRLF